MGCLVGLPTYAGVRDKQTLRSQAAGSWACYWAAGVRLKHIRGLSFGIDGIIMDIYKLLMDLRFEDVANFAWVV